MDRDKGSDIFTFNDIDAYRYGGVKPGASLPPEAMPGLFTDAVKEQERVQEELQAIETGNSSYRNAGQELVAKADLTKRATGLELFIGELAEKAGDVIIDFDLPTAA